MVFLMDVSSTTDATGGEVEKQDEDEVDVTSEKPSTSSNIVHSADERGDVSSSVDVQSTTQLQKVEDSIDSERKRGPKLSKEERYLRMKEHRRVKRKEVRERRKKQKQTLRETGVPKPESTTASALPQRHLMADSSCSQRIVIDCSFDDLMSLKDVCKLHHQLNQCYGLNRRAPNPGQFYICGLSGQLTRRFEETDNALGSRWDVHVLQSSVMDTFKLDELVYLSSESETVLEKLEPSKVYVIGGLVDHNHHKGHCHKVATEAGMATARLPIDRYLRLNSRCVLTVNHVFHILLLMTQTGDWGSSLREVVPRRKCLSDVKGEEEQVAESLGNEVNDVNRNDSESQVDTMDA